MATDKKISKQAAVGSTGVKKASVKEPAGEKQAKPSDNKAKNTKPEANSAEAIGGSLVGPVEKAEANQEKTAGKAGVGKRVAAGKKAKAQMVVQESDEEKVAVVAQNVPEASGSATAPKTPKKEKESKTVAAVVATAAVTDKPAKGKKVSEKIALPIKQVATVAAEKPLAAKKTPKKAAGAKNEAAALLIAAPVPVKKAAQKAVPAPVKQPVSVATVSITFQIRFNTKFGQTLYLTGNHEIFGQNDVAKALPMQYLNHEFWTVTAPLEKASLPAEGIVYNYFIRYEDGAYSFDWGKDKLLLAGSLNTPEVLIIDSWNFAGYFENAFYTEPFKQVLLKQNYTPVEVSAPLAATHVFKVKAPLLQQSETLAISGSAIELGAWNADKLVLLAKQPGDDFFVASVDLTKAAMPVSYKYLVYNVDAKKVVRFEEGANRSLYNAAAPGRQTIVNDGFAMLPNNTWKGAGVAMPVFSLRSQASAGVGEFADIKLLVDWAKKTSLRLVQLLPVNDTTATHTWTDSYPYAAISAFALHPMYLRLEDVAEEANQHIVAAVNDERVRLNALAAVDYEAVNSLKWAVLKQLYPLQKNNLFATEGYKLFYSQNSHWLLPYAAFCYLRDKYGTADFNNWPAHKNYLAGEIDALTGGLPETFDGIAVHFFIQYHLHLQLTEATQYAHQNGVIVKGDIPIGVYRYGADAWQSPALYHMDMQAGAPPDDFAVTGQNWGFPTYNWAKMKEDGFAWWKQRLEQMSYYFDAFRIDHILGFFRIWGIPVNQVEGIMGHFEPSIPIHINEFNEKGIWFDYNRYCAPYITDKVLEASFGNQQDYVRLHFLESEGTGSYRLKPEYATQRQLETYFGHQEDNAHNRWLKQALFNLLSNVILFEVEGSNGQQFHCRFGMEGTSSFQSLYAGTQQQLRDLYVNYYFRRQDGFWMKNALQTLPALKRVTNMLVCGEDLGLVPACVPDVMKQLGLLSLEIQRMPKDSKKEFFHPADAPYLSVVTPSTHDMSTIRGWWEEDRQKTQKFYNNELGQWGTAPHFCDAWVNKAIVVQHLNSPGMWAIFQLQDLMGIDKGIRRDNPHEERINVPAIPKYYWRYRMHITLEQLLEADSFNTDLLKSVKDSGRG